VRFDEYLQGGNNPDEPGWFIQWLVDDGDVHAFTFDEAWFDIGTPDSYLEAVSWQLQGDNYVADSATIEDTTLGENVHVLDGAEVVNSNLDRAVIFPRRPSATATSASPSSTARRASRASTSLVRSSGRTRR